MLMLLCHCLLLLRFTLLVYLVHSLDLNSRPSSTGEFRHAVEDEKTSEAKDSQGRESQGSNAAAIGRRAAQLKGGCYHLLERMQILKRREETKR